MRAVVLGYSNVGDRCLRVLAAGGVELPLVVTHRDHPGETLWFARVADTAAELGLPVVYAEDLDDAALIGAVAAARPDAIFSFYFRRMLPRALLELCPGRAFNLHGSLLPKFRGRAPTNWAVLKGATETGATLHEMTEKPDAGAIVDRSAVPILPDDTAEQVFDKVCVAAEQVLWRSLPAIVAGNHPRLPNDLAAGSYFGGRQPEDGRIDFSRPAAEVYALIRAVAPPYPGAFVDLAGERLIVAAARPLAREGGREGRSASAGATAEASATGTAGPAATARAPDATGVDLPPGLHALGEGLVAVCGDGGRLRVLRLTDRAGRPLDAAAFVRLGTPAAVAPPSPADYE